MKNIIFLILSILLMAACNSVKKSTASVKSNIDSSRVISNESAAIKKVDSTGTKTEEGNYEKKTVYAYDTIYQVVKGDTVLKYVPRIVTVYEKGNYLSNETAQKKSIDSAVSKQKDSTGLIKKVDAGNTYKQSSRMPIGLIIGGVIALILIVCFAIYRIQKI